ncbi:MAG: hypothetical protein K2X03_02220 [Bryobacteraceae bacterium]|nr:hypothetical protein [Bryobacteraceae bacterium]
MKNAHLRTGKLQFIKVLRDTATDVTLHLDRLVAERAAEGGSAQCHLLSVIGNDQEVAAIAAAIADEARFYATAPALDRLMISLGKDPEVFRASINIPGRRRPLRHLIAISAELARTRIGGDPRARRTILVESDPTFLLYRLGARFGLPVLPEWNDWFVRMIESKNSVERLIGIGCDPVVVKGTKKRFLGWIGHALRRAVIHIPERSQGVRWQAAIAFQGAEESELTVLNT